MDKYFKQFIENITLTTKQNEDAQTKYSGVCEKLHSVYYGGEYNGDKKFLFGSYKTKTNIRPMSEKQDVDVLFKIPQETFEKFDNYTSNGQSALLQEIKKHLSDKYSTTDEIKAWGKVVLVKFADNHHNVELLPALEMDDNTFLIPNSEGGGKWESFNPRAEIEKFANSNEKTGGLTRDLAKMLKAWAHNTTSMKYKSFKRMNDIINFLACNYQKGRDTTSYAKILFDFFDYMHARCDDGISSYINTAFTHAQKALEYYDNGQLRAASEQWRCVFGKKFPLAEENLQRTEAREITNPARPWSF